MFSIGEKVRVVSKQGDKRMNNGSYVTDAIREQGYGYISGKKDDVIYVLVAEEGETSGDYYIIQDLRKWDKTMENLQVGDVIFDDDGDEVTVLAVCSNLYALSHCNDSDTFEGWFTLKELKYDYKLTKDEEDIKELTLDEVAELAGVSVDKLRIKD